MDMRRCYLAAAFLLAPWSAQAQQVIEADNVMPPALDDTTEVVDDNAASVPSVSDDTDASSPPVALENVEMELVARAIYQCMDHGRAVFADEENRTKYTQCVQIRAAHYQQVAAPNGNRAGSNSPCSGAVVYQGGTYVFNDQEPCPIPDAVFKSRKPIEANPEYYAQPQP